MNPYLTREAYQVETSAASRDEPDEHNVTEVEREAARGFKPTKGDFMFFMGLPQKNRDWFLVRVVDFDVATGDVVFHYYNNTVNRARFRPVWTRETPDGHVEKQQQLQPKGFQQSQQYAYRDDFCWCAVDVKQLFSSGRNPDGVLVTKQEERRVLKYRHRPGL